MEKPKNKKQGKKKTAADFRPQLIIEIIEEMASLGCTTPEVCAFFRVSEVDLEEWLQKEYDITWAELRGMRFEEKKLELRRSQFQLAKHNPIMSMFLGKNILGQQSNPATLPNFSGGLVEIVKTMRKRIEQEENNETLQVLSIE